jgi:hypothetical protein
MKRSYSLTLLILFFAFNGFSQLSVVNVNVTDNLPKANTSSQLNKKSASSPKACSRDTVEYPRYKASRLYFVNMKKGYSLGQFYGAPQDITVHGFTFYAFVNANPPSSKKVRVICNIYKAGTDSLPSGTPLRSDTIVVDSTLGGGLLSNVVKRANFKTPVTVNFPYVLTVESDSADNTAVVVNDWYNGDGDKRNFLSGSVSGRWYRGLSLNIGGQTLDADVLLHPHVSYNFGTDFTFKDCSDFKDSARFKNQYISNVSGSSFYNVYSFYPNDWFCHLWNYGELPWNTYVIDGINDYSGKGNFQVRLISRLFQWHLTNGGYTQCVDTTIKTYYFKPTNPFAVSNTNICRGDSANIIVASDTGTVISWYRNPVDTKPVFVGKINRLGIPQSNDTFYLKAVNYHCESGFTKLIVSVNDYPNHPIIKNDSICTGAKANLGATSSIGITEWFLDSTRLPIRTGNLFQTNPLFKEQTYFVRANNNGCYSPFFKTVTAYVDNGFAPEDPITSADTVICLRPAGVATLSAFSNTNDSIRWFDVPSGGVSIASGNYLNYKAVTKGSKTFYVEVQKSTCASSRLPIHVTIGDYPTITTVFKDEKCKGDTAIVGVLISSFGQVNWYNTSIGGMPVANGTVIKHYTNKSKDLYAEADENGCAAPARTKVSITINSYDSITKIDAPWICGSQTAKLKVTAGTSNIKWYEDQAATKLLSSTSDFTTPKLTISTYYYFTAEKNNCISPVNEVLVEVLPLPIPGFKDSIIKGHKIRFTPYTNSGVKYKWVMGDGNSYTTKLVTHGYALYGSYDVKLTVTSLTSGCFDSMSRNVIFDFSGIKPIDNGAIIVNPNPASGSFKITLRDGVKTGVVSIISNNGQVVYRSALSNQSEIILKENLSSGIYVIKVDSERGSAYTRLMIR